MEVKGAKSSFYTSTSEVPQGSNLGPLLFVIAINDINKVVCHSKALMFADDFKIFLDVSSECDCKLLQSDLVKVSEWCKSNGFNLNISKCACMSFTLSQFPTEYQYTVNTNILLKTFWQLELTSNALKSIK